MAEEKKSAPAARGKDLSSKIAAAYRSIPPEEREKMLHGSEDIQNPELDRTFEKLVETYRTKRGDNSVVPFPRSAPPVARDDDEESPEGEGYECAECGHMNPQANQFCGMCGAAQSEAAATVHRRPAEGADTQSLGTEESKVRHHHHYYHHHHYRNNPYLLLAVVLLLGVIAWQEVREYRPAVVSPVVASPAAPSQVQPSPVPTPAEAKPTPVQVSPTSSAPAPSKPPKAAAKPLFRESPSVLEAKAAAPSNEAAAPPESAFHKFMSSLLPTLVPPPAVVPNRPSPAPSPAATPASKQ